MKIESYRDELRCGKTILKIEIDDNIQDIEEAKRLIAEDVREQLRKYWKIEEELGIPLEVLFKALKDGIYYGYDGEIIDFTYVSLCKDEDEENELVFVDNEYNGFRIKNYGKTWALTMEELEDESSK